MTTFSSYDFSKPLFIGGITLSAIAAGGVTSFSVVSIPALLSAREHPNASKLSESNDSTDSLILTQWRRLFDIAQAASPATFLSAALCHLFNAYIHYAPLSAEAIANGQIGNWIGGRHGTRRTYLFASAAAALILVVPFTRLIIMPVNAELMRREEKGRGVVGEWTTQDDGIASGSAIQGSTESLLQRWRNLNFMRSSLIFAGVILGWEAL